jgi:Carboxypeptidase regulatory-like domain/TonB dependent receptor
MHRARTAWRGLFRLAPVLLIVMAAAVPAMAQISTAMVQGKVTDQTGVLPGVTVTAREMDSGFSREATTDADGVYTLAGLRPGTYEIRVTLSQYKPQARTVTALVGQTLSVDFRVSPDVTYSETVQVVSERLSDIRTPEIATNVTLEQIRYLPQNTRNFLNMAALAPNLRVSDSEFQKEVTSGALPSQHTNVFIDGVSFKNDLILGGVVGQDSSRGSPFPQNAVQEFQVVTQNFKAEYEKASSAIITAITKSGGNRYAGEVFGFYQDKRLVQHEGVRSVDGLLTKIDDLSDPPFNIAKPTYERWQWGASLGGPIVRNRMQFFGSYEENRQDRDGTVIVGTVTGAPQALVDRLRTYEGTFTSPFRERLLFGKTSYQPQSGQHLQITYNFRNETDIRGFGGQGGSNSYETAENVRNRVDSLQGKYQIAGTKGLNETYLSYQRYRWNPTAENYDIVGENFSGLLRIGGRDTNQHMVQQRTTLRNDHTRFMRWHGSHTAKAGGSASYADYNVSTELNGNPLFTYLSAISWNFPARAAYGVGDPTQNGTNWQFGLFAQDDWAIAPRLTLNLGLRWDFETGMINTDYVTPDAVRQVIAPFVDNNRYFTDGDDRSPFYAAWQPRLGFSFDVLGSGRTVAFGGFGRYFDRVLYGWTQAERARLQYATRTFQFSETGGTIRDGAVTIAWDPSYLSRQGLDSLIERGIAPAPEVHLMDNEVKPPVSDQWSLGLRQKVGNIVTSLTYSGIRSRHILTFIRGNRRADGTCCVVVPGYSAVIIADPEGRKAWFDGLYVQAERPYGADGQRWGFSFTYTLGRSEEDGGDRFSLDYRTAADYPRHPTGTDERHRVVATGIVGLPFDFVGSLFITLGTGTPFTINDQSQGVTADLSHIRRNAGRPADEFKGGFIIPDAWAYRSVDLQVEKAFRFGERRTFSVIFQGFNIFSFDNFTGYQGNIPTLPATNPNFGRPNSLIDPGSRLQFGMRYGF